MKSYLQPTKFVFYPLFSLPGPQGDYWRMLLKGTYTIHVHAPGYKTSSKVVTVRNKRVTRVNFELEIDRCLNRPTLDSVNGYFIEGLSSALKQLGVLERDRDGCEDLSPAIQETLEGLGPRPMRAVP